MRIRDSFARPAVRRLFPAAVVVVSVVVAMVAFGSLAVSTRVVGPLTVEVRLAASTRGITQLQLPPFGGISVDSHAAPLSARFSVVSVDIAALEALAVGGIPTANDVAGWRRALYGSVLAAAAKGVSAALIIAGLVAAGLTRSRRRVLEALGAVAVVSAIVLGLAWSTFDVGAFREPRYEGALQYAPTILAIFEQRVGSVTNLQREVSALAGDLAAYYTVPQSFASAGSLSGTIRVLHVSDLHLDPVGMQLMIDLAEAYDVDLIIDTGDMSHFGTSGETAAALAQLGSRPYMFVPGNHDTPELVAAFARDPRVTVLGDETTTTPSGLLIAGVADPASAGDGLEPDSAASSAAGKIVAEELKLRAVVPDIVAVHDPVTGTWFEDLAAIVLSGHTHTPSLEKRGGTWFLGAGTTGGVHFAQLRTNPNIPHSAAVLYFEGGAPPHLVAIDQIEVYGKSRRSSVSRTLTDSLTPTNQSDTPTVE